MSKYNSGEVKYAAHKIIRVTFQLQLLLPQTFLSYLQTNATTSNIVGPAMLGVIASICTKLKV